MKIYLYNQGSYAVSSIIKNGDNISGSLILIGNPSQTLEAVPKQYVDAHSNNINADNLISGTLSAARLPAFIGDLQSVEGTSNLVLKNSTVAAGTYPKVSVNEKGIVISGSNLTDSDIPFGLNWSKINPVSLPTSLSGYGITDGVSVNGATMTGFLSLSQPPSSNTHAVTKQYIDTLISNGSISVGDIIRKPYPTTPPGFLKCNGALVDKTTYADLYAVIGDTFGTNPINTTPGSGKPWQQQYQINEIQYTDITGWVTNIPLPGTIASSQAIVTKNRVYILGGYDGAQYTNNIYTAAINADGTLGTWSIGIPLPGAIGLSQAIVAKNRVYILGGYDGAQYTNNIYTAAINADGTLGTWSIGTPLPGALGWSQAIITNNRVYLLGGYDGAQYTNIVYTAAINDDGTLGTWTTGTPLPGALGLSQAIVTKNRVYLLGGRSGNVYVNTIYTAIINADGTLGKWFADTPLPGILGQSQAIVTKNRVYLLGGYNGTQFTNTVYTAPINVDGTLGAWTTGTPLPVNLDSSQLFITNNKVYLVGGFINTNTVISTIYSATISGGLNDYSQYYKTTNTISGSGKPWKQQYQINTIQSTDITGWVSDTPLPGKLSHSHAIVTKNRVYLLGGYDGAQYTNTVYTAPINVDGTLGTWTTGTPLPGALGLSQAIVTKNRVYLLGGDDGAQYTNNIYTAAINADGTLGTWSIGTPLPGALGWSQAIVTSSKVYLIGGYSNNGYTNTVYTSTINSDGTLGTWTADNPLPVALSHSQAIVTNNRVYLLSGRTTGSVYTNAVYTATINADGTLGTWSTGTSLPGALGVSQAIVTKNRVYLLGGVNGYNFTNAVYTAPINADGTLGAWTTGTPLPGALGFSQAIVTSSKVYLIGGYNNSAGSTSTVYSANISGGLNDYSPYYDGTIQSANNTNLFALPDFTNEEPFGSYSYIKY